MQSLQEPNEKATVLPPLGTQASEEACLSELLGRTMSRIKPLGYSAFFMVRPDPFMAGNIGRKLEVSSMPGLLRWQEVLEAGCGHHRQGAFEVNLAGGVSSWANALLGQGFRSALVLRIPVSDAHDYEFTFLSMSGPASEAARQAVSFSIWADWPSWRSAIQRELCPLTVRERAALKATVSGLTGSAAAETLGCVERTFRLHIDNAKKKAFAANAAEAAYKATLLFAF